MKQLYTYLSILLAVTSLALHADIVINEFSADNKSILADEDGDYSDWIELKNTSESAVNLAGWYLTDNAENLTKWEFPSTSIAPDEFLIVFASGKDRAISGSELHTNFGLSRNGEFLALVNPDGSTIEYSYSPNFPGQIEDITYGLAGGTTKVVLVGEDAPCTALIPTNNSLGSTWRTTSFNDRSWDSGTTGVGYDTNTTYDSLINLDLEADMYESNSTAYIRVPFTVTNTDDIVSFTLRMKYDDGFAAFINGELVASKNPPAGSLEYNSAASAQQPDTAAVNFESFDISVSSNELVVGNNMLAIHALNRSNSSSDMLIVPELTYTYVDSSSAQIIDFLDSPTPGAENSSQRTATSAPVTFSAPGGVYSNSFTVSLSSESPTIYYTLDGSEPTTNSTQYTNPISINSTTHLRARSSEAGLSIGEISSETYSFLAPDILSFSSNLPVIVVDSLGTNEISNLVSESAQLTFFEPGDDGRTYLEDDFSLSSRAGIRRRGETSLRDTDNKPNLAVETWGPSSDDDSNISPLGMPSQSDWILWAPHTRDLSGLRNAFIYNLSNQTGNYAVRTRFVEVFLNLTGGDVSMADYVGYYLFIEKIKRDDDRVNVEALSATDDTLPNISGGYILRVDKSDPGQNGLSGMVQQPMYCEYPTPTNITDPQETYISNYIIDFEAQLSNPDPSTGYPSFINVDSFIDHNIFNLTTKNADGLRYSTYLHKPRGGKLTMGPIWDFDRSVDSSGDDRDDEPTGWVAYRNEDVFSDYINYSEARHWWGLLFENADFWQAYIDRWQELRLDIFSDANITKTIDDMAAEIAEARERDLNRWSVIQPRSGSNGLNGTQQGEVDYMKWWLATRMAWIDDQFIPAPEFSQSSTATAESFQLTINQATSHSVYYTLDGTDPRAAGGSLASNAQLYIGPITVEPDTLVSARAWTRRVWGGDPPEDVAWSGLTTGIYNREDLLLTEVHYNPRDPDSTSIYTGDAFEFVELQNTGSTTIDLSGYTLDGGIEFSFADSAVTTLAPQAHVVIVRDLTAFESRYDTSSMSIAGEFTGKLSNGGENIRLEFYGKRVYDISYNDARGWPTAADGGGHSLIPVTNALSLQGFDILDYSGNWRASTYIDGSPGTSDPVIANSILVNELSAHTDTGAPVPFDSNDVIELYNPTEAPIVLDGFWYLSDDANDPEKWNIPQGTIIPAGGWINLDEDDFHPNRDSNGFGLNKAGEQVVLSHRPGSGLDRIVDLIDFKGQANGASWGRYPDGTPYFQTLIPTGGYANELAADTVKIVEVMYNPFSISDVNEDEFLEYILLNNTSNLDIVLEDLDDNSGTWRLDGGVEYSFESGVTIHAGEDVWLVPFDPELEVQSKAFFCSYYGLDANTARLIGPYSGDLSDSGERVTIERPQASDAIDIEEVSWIIVDEATWMDEYPWSSDADGTGLALKRIGAAGNDPLSWTTDSAELSSDNLRYEKATPGTSDWNAFTSIANLSNSDFADTNASNGVSISIAAGTHDSSGGSLSKLLDGLGQNSDADASESFLFTTGTTTARVLVDLQSIQEIYQINTYSWHSGDQQNQDYDLYYSTTSTAPDSSTANAMSSIELVINGWAPLGSANSDFETNTPGQIGVSWLLTSTPLSARYLLFDIKDPLAFWGEIDILTADQFVANGVPKAWLSNFSLPQTNAAALLDSDLDGQLNWEEYQAGTNPLESASVFTVKSSEISDTQFSIRWNAVAGKTYSLRHKFDLNDPDWVTIASGILGIEPETSVLAPADGDQGFIQVVIEP